MRSILRRFALAAPVAAGGLVLGLTLPSIGTAGGAGALPRPERELAQAQRLASFRLQLPAWLPSGTALERVSWPDVVAGERPGVTAVDVWYRLANGTRLHVWQSNRATLEKDPVGRGVSFRLRGTTWWRERAALGTALSGRTPEGITVQVTGRVPDAVLERIAKSIGG